MTAERPSLRRRAFASLGRRKAFAAIGVKLAPFDTWMHDHTGGRLSLAGLAGQRSLLLTTTGRKSGQPREVSLIYTPWQDGWAVIASNYGQAHHPAWSANLLAQPDAVAVVGRVSVPVRARLVTGEERDRIWAAARINWPGYDSYAERSARDIRVFILERR